MLFQQPDGAAARDWLLRQAGVPAADVDAALALARGNPGRALHLIEADGLGLQRAVVDDLRALTLGKAGAADIAGVMQRGPITRKLHGCLHPALRPPSQAP